MFQRYRELQERRANEESEGGFTLIELLIVIVVLGILAAIVIFSLTGVTGQSQVAACNTDAKSVQTAVAAYQTQNGNVTALTGSAGMALLQGPYLHTTPPSVVGTSGYAITLDATTPGQVDVLTGTGPTSTVYDNQTSTTGCNAA